MSEDKERKCEVEGEETHYGKIVNVIFSIPMNNGIKFFTKMMCTSHREDFLRALQSNNLDIIG